MGGRRRAASGRRHVAKESTKLRADVELSPQQRAPAHGGSTRERAAERGKARELKGTALITSTSIEAGAKASKISALPQRGCWDQRAEDKEDSACSSQQDCPRIYGLVMH